MECELAIANNNVNQDYKCEIGVRIAGRVSVHMERTWGSHLCWSPDFDCSPVVRRWFVSSEIDSVANECSHSSSCSSKTAGVQFTGSLPTLSPMFKTFNIWVTLVLGYDVLAIRHVLAERRDRFDLSAG